MTNSELQKRIFELETQNQKLMAENQSLRELLSIAPVASCEKKDPEPLDQGLFSVHKHSQPKDKIQLFMSLFCGRTDVYARRWYSSKTNKGNYSPVCKNEWERGICEKPRVKCKQCPHREYVPLTANAIDHHLRSKDENGVGVVGVYPLLQDETCYFLAVDFDKENWREDIATFRCVCEEANIPVAIERSRSGNGGHAWFFFEEPVMASLARRLGSALLTAAMTHRHELRFDSYDRMFPNQD